MWRNQWIEISLQHLNFEVFWQDWSGKKLRQRRRLWLVFNNNLCQNYISPYWPLQYDDQNTEPCSNTGAFLKTLVRYFVTNDLLIDKILQQTVCHFCCCWINLLVCLGPRAPQQGLPLQLHQHNKVHLPLLHTQKSVWTVSQAGQEEKKAHLHILSVNSVVLFRVYSINLLWLNTKSIFKFYSYYTIELNQMYYCKRSVQASYSSVVEIKWLI